MDTGRQWALTNLGPYGPRIREEVARAVREEHDACIDAQEASGHRSQGVYGEFWRGVLERLEPLAKLPEVALVRPGAAPYRVPVVRGYAIYPWRYARARKTPLDETMFSTSPARSAVMALPATAHTQEALDVNIPDAGLTDEDRDLLRVYENVGNAPAAASRLLLVAISSSSNGLFSAEWGEVQPKADDCLRWSGFHEDLRSVPTKPVSTSPTGTFTSGHVPGRQLGAREAGSE